MRERGPREGAERGKGRGTERQRERAGLEGFE